jgi:hypothetical protein
VCVKEQNTVNSSQDPNFADKEVWNQTMDRVKAIGRERLTAEQKRMRDLGILDEEQPTSDRWPDDMKSSSETSLAT